MNILASLVSAYEKMPAAPPFGFSSEKISFVIPLREDGIPAGQPVDIRVDANGSRKPQSIYVPASFKRPGVTPRSFFLWDNTAFALGVSAIEGRECEKRHQAFRKLHWDALEDIDDTGLLALRSFVMKWRPEDFIRLEWPEDMKDQNIVFALETECEERMIHQREAARTLWMSLSGKTRRSKATCLVTGKKDFVARLHPTIKGVWGAQSVGASLVSFNLDACTSYGHKQGDNAPVSEFAAFAYGTALNEYLKPGSRHRLQFGDASTVYWAEAANTAIAKKAEVLFAAMFDGGNEATLSPEIHTLLQQLRDGAALETIAPELADGICFSILGLAPNVARLSVRFWFNGDFATIARNYCRFIEDTRVDPPPHPRYPALWRYIVQTAALARHENVPPNLISDWMYTLFTGAHYPLTLLSTTLMRIRGDKDVNALRAAILKALLIRNYNRRDISMALDMSNINKGYLLGRLFAAYEYMQSTAHGARTNSTIKDSFYGPASAQPRKVFALLDKNSANHLAKINRTSPGKRVKLEKHLSEIMRHMKPETDPFPLSLSTEEQALFGLGYYHQRSEFFKPRSNTQNLTGIS